MLQLNVVLPAGHFFLFAVFQPLLQPQHFDLHGRRGPNLVRSPVGVVCFVQGIELGVLGVLGVLVGVGGLFLQP